MLQRDENTVRCVDCGGRFDKRPRVHFDSKGNFHTDRSPIGTISLDGKRIVYQCMGCLNKEIEREEIKSKLSRANPSMRRYM